MAAVDVAVVEAEDVAEGGEDEEEYWGEMTADAMRVVEEGTVEEACADQRRGVFQSSSDRDGC